MREPKMLAAPLRTKFGSVWARSSETTEFQEDLRSTVPDRDTKGLFRPLNGRWISPRYICVCAFAAYLLYQVAVMIPNRGNDPASNRPNKNRQPSNDEKVLAKAIPTSADPHPVIGIVRQLQKFKTAPDRYTPTSY